MNLFMPSGFGLRLDNLLSSILSSFRYSVVIGKCATGSAKPFILDINLSVRPEIPPLGEV